MSLWKALGSGCVGACTVTLLNEVGRRVLADAPHLERLGMRGIAKTLQKADQAVPPQDTLFWLSLAGDLASNAAYYSLVGSGKDAGRRGALLGLAAGIGAITLPAPLGLGRTPTERTPLTRVLTVLWYLAGGLTAGVTAGAIADSSAQS